MVSFQLFATLLMGTSQASSSSSSSSSSSITQQPLVSFWNSDSCPYAQRVWIALLEKGIDFDYQKVNLQNKDATPEFDIAYYKANPNIQSSSKVPLLIVKETTTSTTTEETEEDIQYYTESKVVLEVLEELFPHTRRLLPENAIRERYHARVFGDAVFDSIFGGDRSPYKMLARKLNDQNENQWDQSKEEETLCRMLEALNTSLQSFHQTGPFVCGDFFSIAECITAPFVQRIDFLLSDYLGMNVLDQCQRHGYDRAGAWWKAVLQRPSVLQTATPDPKASVQRVLDIMSKAL